MDLWARKPRCLLANLNGVDKKEPLRRPTNQLFPKPLFFLLVWPLKVLHQLTGAERLKDGASWWNWALNEPTQKSSRFV